MAEGSASRHLFLHVGMHKTGTSAIQNTLFAQRALLAEHGFGYFDAVVNHSALVFMAFAERPERSWHAARVGMKDPATLAATAAANRDRLQAFLERSPHPKLIISGEEISSLDPGGARRMLEFFRRHVGRITVIGFVRPPRSFIASALQQRIKGGKTVATIGQRLYPAYRNRFSPYLQAGDLAETVLQMYAPGELVAGCSVATLLSLIGAPPGLHGQLTVRQENASMSRTAVALCLAMNEQVPIFRNGLPNQERAKGLLDILMRVPGPRFTMPAAVLDQLAARPAVREDIAWMEQALGRSFEGLDTAGEPGGEQHASPEAWAAAELTSLGRDELHRLMTTLNARLLAEQRRGGRSGAA